MTHKKIKWEDLEKYINDSKKIVDDFSKIKEIETKIKELEEEVRTLDFEKNNISEQYKQEYSKSLNDKLDNVGILKVITCNDEYEAHILSITNEETRIRYYTNYGSYKEEEIISTKELQENGFVTIEKNNGKLFVVDDIKNPEYIFEIIKYRMNFECNDIKRKVEYGRESIKEYEKNLEDNLKELEKYKKVSDGMITKEFNKISFGLTGLKIDDILKTLPREIVIYKGE